MKENKASRTAQYMALFRAIETARPKRQRLFSDPYAIHFLDRGLQRVARISSWLVIGGLILKIIQARGAGALSSGIARTKYIDDLLEQTIRGGVRRVIILGAGFDTRALRLGFLKDISVIEIDHPDTAQFKIEKLIASTGQLPHNVEYFQLDFNKQALDDLARQHGLTFDSQTTIIWEGVTNYLTEEAIDKTLEFVSKFSKGSFLIFTYIDKSVLDKPESFEGTEKLFKRLKESEEQWTFGFNPTELSNYLHDFNLTLLEDCGAADFRKKYMPERRNLLKGYEFYRVAFAKRTE